MIEGLDLKHAAAVIEYGPGLGTFTDIILKKMGHMGPARSRRSAHPAASEIGAQPPARSANPPRFLAIERNHRMAQLFRARHPGVRLHQDDAANVREICRQEGIGSVDYVVSGLGWPSFSDETRARILLATAAVLRPGGEFRTFGYHCGLLMRGAWHFRGAVERLFSEVTISKVVWMNMPPAFVYRCVR
jgi:phospholipid N-methyltransferase